MGQGLIEAIYPDFMGYGLLPMNPVSNLTPAEAIRLYTAQAKHSISNPLKSIGEILRTRALEAELQRKATAPSDDFTRQDATVPKPLHLPL
jgi:hypothetical protein